MKVRLSVTMSMEIEADLRSIVCVEGHELRDVASSLLMRGVAIHRKDGVLREQGIGKLYVAPNYNPHLGNSENRITVKIPISIQLETKKYIDAIALAEEMRFGQVAFWLLIRGLESYKRENRSE